MSIKEKFEAQLAAVKALRQMPRDEMIALLRSALSERNNYLVAKAAALLAELRIVELAGSLSSASSVPYSCPLWR